MSQPNDTNEPSPASAGSHGSNGPVAYYVHGSEYDTGCEFEFVTLSREHAEAAGGTVKTLVQITDEEREALSGMLPTIMYEPDRKAIESILARMG
jgi:hypothetical protein